MPDNHEPWALDGGDCGWDDDIVANVKSKMSKAVNKDPMIFELAIMS